jgi:hypothetical protein
MVAVGYPLSDRLLVRLTGEEALLPTLASLFQRPALARRLGTRARHAAEIEHSAGAGYGAVIVRLMEKSPSQ